MFFFYSTEPDDPNHMTLEEILIFFTGSDKIPPLGFITSPSIAFNKDNDYSTSSTCALSLILHTKYCDSSTFKEKVTFGFQTHDGYGLPELYRFKLGISHIANS